MLRSPPGWEVFYRIPLSFLRLFWPDFTFTGNLRANVYKCGDLTRQEHYLAWNPVYVLLLVFYKYAGLLTAKSSGSRWGKKLTAAS